MPGGGGGRQAEKLPPKWVDLADRVEEVIERVKPKSEFSARRSGGVGGAERTLADLALLLNSRSSRQATCETHPSRLQRSLSRRARD